MAKSSETKMGKLLVRITLLEELLGTASANTEIHSEYIASKAPDAKKLKEEIESLGVEEVEHKAMTVFPRDDDGTPIMWDYQVKGFFKESCSMIRMADKDGSYFESGKIKAYKKAIDGLIFVSPRKIRIRFKGEIGNSQRPLRAQTMQGERVALANSETIPAGAKLEFAVTMMDYDKFVKAVKEWLSYGEQHGLGQWRNSGKGKFIAEVSEDNGETWKVVESIWN